VDSEIIVTIPGELSTYKDELQLFVSGMVAKLYDNRHKGKWENLNQRDAVDLLQSEMNELHDALQVGDLDAAYDEAIDVANFALMIGSMSVSGVDYPFAPRVKVGRPREFLDWALSQETDMCVIWPFRSRTGPNQEYGALSKGVSTWGRRAHRASCAEKHGPPPTPEHEASHLCGNSLCVNHRHLQWQTSTENQAQKKIHDINVTPVYLDWEKAEVIRAERALGASVSDLSVTYGVSKVSIYNVLNRKTYNGDT
jgi:hypothetical protein